MKIQILFLFVISLTASAEDPKVSIELFDGKTVNLEKDVKEIILSEEAPNKVDLIELYEGTIVDSSDIVSVRDPQGILSGIRFTTEQNIIRITDPKKPSYINPLQNIRDRQNLLRFRNGNSNLRMVGGDGSGG